MKKKLIIVLGLFALIALGLFYFLSSGWTQKRGETARVKEEAVSWTLMETGVIQSERVQTYLSPAGAQVGQVYVSLGDMVDKGAPLVSYASDLDLEIEKIDRQMDALEARYGELLGADSARLRQAQIDLSARRRALEAARKEEDRQRALFDEGAIARAALETVVENRQAAKEALDLAQADYEALIKGAPARTKESYQAEMDQLILSRSLLKEDQDQMSLKAPFKGQVTDMTAFEGKIYGAGQRVVEVQDPAAKVLVVDFMAKEVQGLKAGDPARILSGGLGLDEADLSVSMVHPKAFTHISQLGVEENRRRVEIPLLEGLEGATLGLEVQVEVELSERGKRLLIPYSAVFLEGGQSYVRLIEGKIEKDQKVLLGPRYGKEVSVRQGLSAGDEILLRYQDRDESEEAVDDGANDGTVGAPDEEEEALE